MQVGPTKRGTPHDKARACVCVSDGMQFRPALFGENKGMGIGMDQRKL